MIGERFERRLDRLLPIEAGIALAPEPREERTAKTVAGNKSASNICSAAISFAGCVVRAANRLSRLLPNAVQRSQEASMTPREISLP